MTGATPDNLRRLAEADALLLLAEWLHRPPTGSSATDPVTDNDLSMLATACGFERGSTTEIALRRTAQARRTVAWAQWEAERSRLFEGAAVCPPNETAYVRRDKGAILGDLAGFYRAFGFDQDHGVGEKHDHVVSQLQFAAILLVMLARAHGEDQVEHEKITREALQAFAFDHLGLWIGLFCERLIETAEHPSFSELGAALLGAWRAVCADNDLPTPEVAEIEPITGAAGSPYECDGCPSI